MNSKGIIRIIEASVSIMLLIGVIYFLFVETRPDFSGLDYDELGRDILEEMSRNTELRKAVLSDDGEKIERFLEKRIPAGTFNHTFTICEVNEVCGMENYVSGEVFAQERVISSDISYLGYSPKKIRLFMWKNAQ